MPYYLEHGVLIKTVIKLACVSPNPAPPLLTTLMGLFLFILYIICIALKQDQLCKILGHIMSIIHFYSEREGGGGGVDNLLVFLSQVWKT